MNELLLLSLFFIGKVVALAVIGWCLVTAAMLLYGWIKRGFDNE